MKVFLTFLGIAIAAFSGCAFINQNEEKFSQYGKWQTYSSSQALHYPDFDLLCNETKEDSRPTDLPLGPIYYFSISSKTSHVDVSWSSGFGDIGPTLFDIDGKKFFLEMINSDYLKRPDSDRVIVIWPESEFYRRKNRWWFW